MANPAEVLKQYPIVVRGVALLSWKGKKGTWAVKTDQGLKVLKKTSATKERQLFLNQAVQHLRRNGAPIPRLVRTRSGSDVAELNGACYVLSNAVQGSSPDYDTLSDLRDIMKTLGRFHRASRGFQAVGEGRERKHLGRWEDGYVRHLEELEAFKTQARRSGSSFSRLYLQYADVFIRHGQDALRMIRGGSYIRWVRKAEREKNLCHQDFAAGNLIRTSRGLYIIDMDSLTYDLPARDLRKIFNKVMKKKGWSMERTVTMLRAYHSVHPLSEDEYQVLRADLLFPHLFYGICSKYYKRPSAIEWDESKTLEKLRAMIRAEESKMQVLTRWDQVVQRAMAQRSGSL
ncbi:CotS family spore coat protein [Paenibacillaceae bacterium WGS1546]|uniref:CotS family spore coat protein n=1 Tax=Cohnella sp. WGS1546 TaxID=3366810 RepID=UPI00372D5DB5